MEFHHLTPFARNGVHALPNLTLRCAPHNALAAEEDFGAELIRASKFTGHESFSAMKVANAECSAHAMQASADTERASSAMATRRACRYDARRCLHETR